jgi:hypothetical protein
VFQLAESRHTIERSDHARRWQQKKKWIKGLSSALAGQLVACLIRDFACLLRFCIRHRSSQRYSRDLTCATKEELYYSYRPLGWVWRALWDAAWLLARMLFALLLWVNCGSVCGKRGLEEKVEKVGKVVLFKRVSNGNVC